MHRDHIGIPLDHDRIVLLLDRLLGEIEAVELALLAVYLALGGVLVLADILVRSQNAAAEGDDPPRNVVHGKDHPIVEAVEQLPVAFTSDRQSGREEKLLPVSGGQGGARHRIALGRTIAQSELLDRGLRKPALLPEIAHADALPLRRLTQVVGEIVIGPAVEGEHRFAVVVAADILLGELPLLHLDAVALGHGFERFGVRDALVLHDEGNGVARLAAAEAFENTFRRRYDERGSLFVVEGTARLIVHTLAFERDVIADDFDDIGCRIDAVYGGAVDESHACKVTNNSAGGTTFAELNSMRSVSASATAVSPPHANRLPPDGQYRRPVSR